MKKHDYINTSLPVVALVLKFIPPEGFKNYTMQVIITEILPLLAIVYLIFYWAIVLNKRMKKINLKCRLIFLSNRFDISLHDLKYNFSNKELKILGFSEPDINQIANGSGMLSEISSSENYIAKIFYE